MSKSTPENSHNDTQEQQHQVGPFRAYVRLSVQASILELFIRSLAMLASAGSGVAYPLMAVIFGNLVNDFNDWALGRLSPSGFRHSVSHNTLWFVYLFVGKVVVSISHFFSISNFSTWEVLVDPITNLK